MKWSSGPGDVSALGNVLLHRLANSSVLQKRLHATENRLEFSKNIIQRTWCSLRQEKVLVVGCGNMGHPNLDSVPASLPDPLRYQSLSRGL